MKKYVPVRPTDPALDGRGSLVKAGWWSMLRTIRYTVTGRSDERNGLIFLVFDDRCQGQSIIVWVSIKFFSEVDPETPISFRFRKMRVCGALFLFGLFPILGRGHLRSRHRILFENLLLYSLYLSVMQKP